MLPTKPVRGNSGGSLVSDLNQEKTLAPAPLENPYRKVELSFMSWKQWQLLAAKEVVWFGFVGGFCFILFRSSELFSGKHPGTVGHSCCDLSICCLAAPDSFICLSFLKWEAQNQTQIRGSIGILGRSKTNPCGGTRTEVVFVLLEVPPERSICNLWIPQ